MTGVFKYAGVDLGATVVRLEDGIQSLTSGAHGGYETGSIILDDIAGAKTFIGVQPFTYEETASANPLVFPGYAFNIKAERGDFSTGANRRYTFNFGDINALMHMATLHDSSAKRGSETGSARIAWLLGTRAMAGIYDNGMVVANAWTYDAADYRGSYGDDVLADIVAQSGDLGRIFFVYWDPVALQPSLFYASPNAVLNTSTLRISNVAADVDSSTTFAPYMDSVHEGASEEVYCGVLVIWAGGQLYRHSATTHATYFGNGFHRDGKLESSRINNATTAGLHADHFLSVHAGQIDTINCTVQLPAAKLTLIDAGMRIESKFSHLPNFSTFTFLRVRKRTVNISPGTISLYDVQLELSTRGISQTGGGPAPGGFPHVGCTTGTVGVVQSAMAGATSVVLPGTPVVGNTLVWCVAGRTTGTYVPPSGSWTQIGPSQACNRNVAGDYPIKIYTRPVAPTDGATITLTPNITTGSRGMMIEILGTPTFDVGSGASTVYGVNDTVSLTPTAGKVALLISLAVVAQDAGSPVGWAAPASGMTELVDTGPPAPQVAVNYQVVAATTGSYTVGSTGNINTTGDTAAVIGVAFYCSASSYPPEPSTWVYDEVPTPTPNGTAVTFTLANTFADGSLLVKVDRLDQTAAVTSYDGAAKTFTLAFAPKTGELVQVTYQGR